MLKFKSRLIIPTVLLLSTISTAPALANPSVDVFDNTMGFVKLVDNEGGVAQPEKTWTFWKQKTGDIRIVLHHSSLPYTP